jgi:hypothetical protein
MQLNQATKTSEFFNNAIELKYLQILIKVHIKWKEQKLKFYNIKLTV